MIQSPTGQSGLMAVGDELISQLDVVSVTDSVVEVFTLRHAVAEDLARLLSSVLNEAAGPSASPSAGPSAGPPNPSGAPSSGQIKFFPDKASNRLIVAAPQSRMSEIKELMTALDTEKPADLALRVIPILHVSAKDLVQEISPLYNKMSGTGLRDRIDVASNSRSNSLIVLSNEANYNAIRDLVRTLDTEEAQEQVIKAFSLTNADAEDVAQQLQELYQGKSVNTRYYYNYGRGNDDSDEPSFVADRRRNTVIVQAPPPPSTASRR